jgi:hypothetical protein
MRNLFIALAAMVSSVSGVLALVEFTYVSHGFPTTAGEYPTVALSSADVDIVLGAETVSVSASFTFVNGGAAADVAIDYPLIRRESEYAVEGDVGERITDDFGGFAYYEEVVDGPLTYIEARRALDVSHVSDDKCLGEYGPSFAVSVDGEPATFSLEERLRLYIEEGISLAWRKDDNVVCLNVPFAESEERTVIYEYDLGYEMLIGTLYPGFWYALYPGATWAGDVGKATITVRRPPVGFDRPIWFSAEYDGDLAPAAFAFDGDTEVFTWHFEDYEPPEFAELNILLGVPPENYGTLFKDLLGMYGAGSGTRVFGRTVADGVPFMTAPSPDAEPVSERTYLPEDTLFVIIGCEGEWWEIRADDAAEGWIRWRYVDEGTGTEKIQATFITL